MRGAVVAVVAVVVVVVAAVGLAADKLDELGLGPDGKPMTSELKSRPPSVAVVGDRGPVWVARPELDGLEGRARIVAAAELAIAGPTPEERARGLRSAFPPETRLGFVDVVDGRVVVGLDLPRNYLRDSAAVEASSERMIRALASSLDSPDIVSLTVEARDPETGGWVPLDRFLPPDGSSDYPTSPDAATGPGLAETEASSKEYPHLGSGHPVGSLSGTDVYLNPGHGWVWRDSDAWGLQRGFVEGNIEDFSNPELVNQWLAAYCYNAGADVFSVREMDLQPESVIVDNDDATAGYAESGEGWFDSTLAGFASRSTPWVNGENPFTFGSNRLVQCVTGPPTASATWTAEIPTDGWYMVSVSHAAYSNRSPEAHYVVGHAGGSTDVRLDQRRRRFTWVPLGTYYFEAGSAAEARRVTLLNDSTSDALYVSADAVRWGGGVGVISRGAAGASGEPRFDEEARYNIQFSGCDDYDGSGDDESDGWSRRPRFGRWLKQAAEAYGAPARDSVFISSHTNGYDGTAHGLSSYVYPGFEGTWHDRLRDAVHDEVLNDLVNGYPGSYGNHGVGKRYGQYGENNPANVSDSMPIFLGEWLFHDSPVDMAMYHDPKFRQMLARAIYQGIVTFWANEHGAPATLLPEPPRNLRCVRTGPTSAVLSWDEPETDGAGVRGDPATGYRVYRSSNGRGFPPGTDVGDQRVVTVSDLETGAVTYLRVSATNGGGESFPSEVVAVRTSTGPLDPVVLVVNGFDKLDASTQVRIPWSGNTLYRHLLTRMNTYDGVVEHAEAISAVSPSLALDSCEAEAVDLGLVDLGGYDAVVWIGGVEAEVSTIDGSVDTSVTAAQRAALTTYVDNGGNLLLSSAEVAWDLDRWGGTTWVDTTLHGDYVADSSGSHRVEGVAGSVFAGLGPVTFDDGSGPAYAVIWPDVLTPTGGASSAMEYLEDTAIEDFEDVSEWWDPNASGQTTADIASTFTLTTSTVASGAGAGDLGYVWGAGSFIREYDSAQPPLEATGTINLWIHGDGSGHRVRLCVRDGDNDLFVNDWLTIDFTGWREIVWNLATGSVYPWYANGNGLLDGPQVSFDSLHVERSFSGPDSGHLVFDQATVSGASGHQVAAIQYQGAGRVVYLGFPFETILGQGARATVMERVLGYFGIGVPGILFADGFEDGNPSAWSATVP